MKVACMCRGGNVRSVAMKIILARYFGHQAVAIGLDNTNAETKAMLFDWADAIVVLKSDFVGGVESRFMDKVRVLDVGDDKYGDPFHEHLHAKLLDLVEADAVLSQGKTVDRCGARQVIRNYKQKTLIRRLEDAGLGTPEYYNNMIDCAAIKDTDGVVWTGKRHGHIFRTIKQAGKQADHGAQGFITMSGQFVDRNEAAALVAKTKQCVLHHPPELYSEDLY